MLPARGDPSAFGRARGGDAQPLHLTAVGVWWGLQEGATCPASWGPPARATLYTRAMSGLGCYVAGCSGEEVMPLKSAEMENLEQNGLSFLLTGHQGLPATTK